jgi:hypothetical protein
MKKILGTMLVLALCSCSNMNHDQQPPQAPQPDKMEMVRHCIHHSGVKFPPPPVEGQAPHKLTHKQKRVLDMCLKENGVEPGSEHMMPTAEPMQ